MQSTAFVTGPTTQSAATLLRLHKSYSTEERRLVRTNALIESANKAKHKVGRLYAQLSGYSKRVLLM